MLVDPLSKRPDAGAPERESDRARDALRAISTGSLVMGLGALVVLVVVTWWAAGHGSSSDPLLTSAPSRAAWILRASGAASSVGSGPVRAALVGVALAAFASRRRWLAIAYVVGVLVLVGVGGRIAKSAVHRMRPVAIERGYALAPSMRILVIAAVLAAGCILLRRAGPFAIALVPVAYLAVVALGRGISTIHLAAGQDSYPSGHAANTMAILAALTLVRPAGRRWTRLTVAGLILVLLIGVSRVTLGFHHPADVLGGWCLAIAIAVGGRIVVGRLGFPASSFLAPELALGSEPT